MVFRMPSFIVTLVRHGETTLNVQRLLQGQTDVPLSSVGVRQAELLGMRMKTLNQTFTKVYSSDLSRAHHTAQLVLKHSGNEDSEIQKDVRLRERCFGSAEGSPAKNLLEEAKKHNVQIHNYTPEGAETSVEVAQRAASFFDDICKLADEPGAENETQILVVSHGGWIQYFLKHLHTHEAKYNLENFDPSKAITIHKNTAISIFSVNRVTTTDTNDEQEETKRYKILFRDVNDTKHLPE